MTGRRRPPRSTGGRTARAAENVPQLSDEEVQRRIDLRGGGTPIRPPIERTLRDRHPSARPQRWAARDLLLILGLLVVGAVALTFLLPDGPLSARSSETPSGTLTAVTSAEGIAASTVPSGSPALVSLPPVITLPPPTEGPATLVPPTVVPTAAPPMPTLAPGATAVPTPKPTKTPTPSPTPTKTPNPTKTPSPTATPGAPKLTVIVNVVNDAGGTAVPADWTVTPGQGGASPASFAGSSAGGVVTMVAGVQYQVTASADTAEADGYSSVRSSRCGSSTGGTLAAGQQATCTITFNDTKLRLTVVTHVIGSASASQWDVSVSASGASPSGTVSGSESGVAFRFDAHTGFDVQQSGPSGYDVSTSGTCSGSGLAPGTVATCTYTWTEQPAPTPAGPQVVLHGLIPAVLLRLWGRRWRTTDPTH